MVDLFVELAECSQNMAADFPENKKSLFSYLRK
jgi:hypothetical protein